MTPTGESASNRRSESWCMCVYGGFIYRRAHGTNVMEIGAKIRAQCTRYF